MDIKLKVFAGLTVALGSGALLYFVREQNKTLNTKMLSQFGIIREAISDHFADCSPEDLHKLLEDKQQFMIELNEIALQYYDAEKLAEELSRIPFFKNLTKPNHQVALFNIEYVSHYLKSQSLDIVNANFKAINAKQVLPQQEAMHELSNNATGFVTFLFNGLISIVMELEEALIDLTQKHRLVQINFYLSLFYDMIEQTLKSYPILSNLVGRVFMSEIGLFRTEQDKYTFGHKCDDNFYTEKITQTESNTECNCLFLDLLSRYTSLITPTIQKKLVTILVDYQVFQTDEHLVKLGNTLLKNAFYLNSQISVDSMYYVADVSVLNHLLIQSLAFSQVREQITQKHQHSIDNYLLYVERALTQNNPKFWAKLLSSLISSHCMVYPMFADTNSLKHILGDDRKTTSVLVHFLGILLINETRDTYEVAQSDNKQMMEWLANNMDTLLASEVICFLQLQFLSAIIKNGDQQVVFPALGKSYLQCLRVTQNKRIQLRNSQRKMLEVNVGLSKIFGYLALAFSIELPTKQSLKKALTFVPFQDKEEKRNIFTNILRILFDLPSMNLHFLKYISPKCEQVSKEALGSFNGYFTHILSSSTLSFDTYMVTLQLAMLFGKGDLLIKEIMGRFIRDLADFATYKDFLIRDLILIVDLIENPYYCLNVLTQQNAELPGLKEIQEQLYQRVAISILQLNAQLAPSHFLDTLQLFIHIKTLPQCILAITEPADNGMMKLRQQFSLNWPFVCLQKDMESVNLFLTHSQDPFDELMYAPESFGYLRDLRHKIFRCPSFLELIGESVKSKHRSDLTVWISKLLYYGKQTLFKDKKQSPELLKLFESEAVQQFITELSANEKASKLVQYLKS